MAKSVQALITPEVLKWVRERCIRLDLSIDTSSTIAAFHQHYPINSFPTLWNKIEQLIRSHRLKMSQVVFEETIRFALSLQCRNSMKDGMC